MNEDKFLLVKGIAGLGNRMLSALTGILYARLTGRRLIVDWRDPTFSNDGTNAFYRFFQCSLSSPNDEIPETDSVNPIIWRGHLHEHATNMRKPYKNNKEFWQRTSIDLTKLDYQEDVLVMWTYTQKVDLLRSHFKGEFKGFAETSTEAILSKLLREDLIIHPQIRKGVNGFKGNNFREKTLGVHVRYTDHRASLWAIFKKLNALLERELGLQIFLATDNIQIKNMFEESYQNVITTPHWYPAPGLRLHEGQNRPDPMESGIEALLDLYLLAECDYLIIDTSSSFSHVASLLTNAPDLHIFNVKQGEKLPEPLRELTWRLMVGLGLFSWGLGFLRKLVRIQKLFRR